MNDRQQANFDLDQLLIRRKHSAPKRYHGVASMHMKRLVDRYVIGQHDNVFHVDFRHEPDPPPRPFPGAASLRFADAASEVSDAPTSDSVSVKAWSKHCSA